MARFRNLKNIELAVLITKFDYSNILPLDSFEFDGTMEFNTDMIQAKNDRCTITRIKFNPAKEKDFEYKANQILNFEIVMPNLKDYDHLVINEMLSLDNVTKIRYCDVINLEQENLDFVKIIKAILSRPNLK